MNISKERKLNMLLELMCDNKETECEGTEKHLIGKKVIVRCREAGVHFGTLISYEGREVVLEDSRRMWHWKASKGHTLSGCAIHGIHNDSKFAGMLDKIILPEACEIIPCKAKAARSIEDAKEYND